MSEDQNNEIIFEMILVDHISQVQLDDLAHALIVDLIEANQLRFGGGYDSTYFRGGLSHEDDNKFDEVKIKSLLLSFAKGHSQVKSIRFIDVQKFLDDGY
jgi:uncharacterized protein YggL (DUF469 family)